MAIDQNRRAGCGLPTADWAVLKVWRPIIVRSPRSLRQTRSAGLALAPVQVDLLALSQRLESAGEVRANRLSASLSYRRLRNDSFFRTRVRSFEARMTLRPHVRSTQNTLVTNSLKSDRVPGQCFKNKSVSAFISLLLFIVAFPQCFRRRAGSLGHQFARGTAQRRGARGLCDWTAESSRSLPL